MLKEILIYHVAPFFMLINDSVLIEAKIHIHIESVFTTMMMPRGGEPTTVNRRNSKEQSKNTNEKTFKNF